MATIVTDAFKSISNDAVMQTPLMLVCPHAGRFFPTAEKLLTRITTDILSLDRRSDAYVDALSSGIVELGATQLTSLIAPTYVNVGRAPDCIDPAHLKGNFNTERAYVSRNARLGQGVISTKLFLSGDNIYKNGCEPNTTELKDRLNRYYFPFHKQLDEHISSLARLHGYVLVLDVHSYSNLRQKDGKISLLKDSPDIVLGNLGSAIGPSCDQSLLEEIKELASTFQYTVAVNAPYSGGYITQKYNPKNPENLIPSETLQIEFLRASYGLNEDRMEIYSFTKWDKAKTFFETLGRTLTDYCQSKSFGRNSPQI